MERDRSAALVGFLRFLSGNPNGDAVARTLVLGALAPVGAIAGQIYGIGRPGWLELIGNFGYPAADAAAFRSIVTNLPLPVSDAFTSGHTIAVASDELAQHYPLLQPDPDDPTPPVDDQGPTRVVCVPIMWSEAPVGVLSVLQDATITPDSDDWLYMEGVASALALWFLEQRRNLIDQWRRAAPPPHREFVLSERQRQVLVMVGEDRTNTEIAHRLGYSIPTIKKDLQEIMKLLGTQDRRTTAGRAREIGLLPDRRARDGAVSA